MLREGGVLLTDKTLADIGKITEKPSTNNPQANKFKLHPSHIDSLYRDDETRQPIVCYTKTEEEISCKFHETEILMKQ